MECFNFPSKFKCGSCPEGYTGNGLKCTPILDPCDPDPCFNGVNCVTVWEGKKLSHACGHCPDGEFQSLS